MGFFDWANGLIADFHVLIGSVAVVVALVLFVFAAVRSRGGIVAMLLAGLGAAFIVWLVTLDGLGFFSNAIRGETNAAGIVSTVIGL